jgi:GTP-binding protein Era
MSTHRCGFAALLGRPNAGKSTLLNALLGERLAIVSARAQTTRSRILGAVHRPGAQILLVDTPGVHRGEARFNQAMNEAALAAGQGADVRILLLDARAEWDVPEARIAELRGPMLLVRTKCDLGAPTAVPRLERFAGVHAISAQSGEGLDALAEAIAAALPESPPLYPEDFLTDAPLRFLAAEQIREVVFEQLFDEIPYAVAVEVQEWKETEADVRLRADLLVERDSQKGIVVGAGGRMLKALGSEARQRIGRMLGKPAHLQLWVKTDRDWTRRRKRIEELGYL